MNNEMAAMVETAKQLGLVTEAMKRQAGAIVHEFQQASQGLSQTVAAARHDVGHIIQSASEQVAQSARHGVDQALAQGAAKYEKSLAAISERLDKAAHGFEQSAQVLSANSHRKLMMGYAAVIGAALLLLLGGGLLVWHYQRAIDEAQARADAAKVSAELYDAYAKANVTSCGGKPCVKLDTKSQRWGNKGEYILLDVAPSANKAASAQ